MSRQRPRVIFFYMNGCPHCERTWPAWTKAKGSLRKMAEVAEKESREVSPMDGVSSFPTFVVVQNGREVKRVEGARENPAALLRELGLRSRPRRTARRRQFTKRTLRNHKSLG